MDFERLGVGFDIQVNSGPDTLATRGGPQARLSFSPGPTNEDEHVQSLISTLEYKKFHLEMIGVKRDHGVYFGVSSLAPSGDGKPVENENYFINARQAVDFSADLKADFGLNFAAWKDIVRTLWVLPSGATVASPTGRRIFFPNGLILGGGTRERRIEGVSDFTWTGWKNHQWLLSLSLADVRLVDSWGTSNFNAVTAKVLPTVQLLPEDQDNVVDPGQSRWIISAALQDQFALSEFFTVTTGIRYDNFDDVGNSLTPRVAGVWRVGERHILKFQYSQAFRPPNFIELYTPATSPGRQGNPDLNPETMETYETGYIYRGMGQVGRATVYYSKLHDMITSPAVFAHSDRKPRNVGSVRSQGVELEWEQALTEDWKVLANLTYADAYDETNRHAVGGSANWLGNLMLKGRVLENLLVTARYSSVGKRDRIPGDDREQLPGYHTLDVTLNVFDFGKKGLTLRTGVKNLFGADIKAPSRANTYVNDLPRPGSIWWAQISQSF